MAKSCWDTALDLLTRRAHTEVELTQKLEKGRFTAGEITETIRRARELKLMEDDRAIAERHARTLAQKLDATPEWTRQKLLKRGVSESLVDTAVRAAFKGWDENAAAMAAAMDDTNPRRVARKLERKGFSPDAIAHVVRQVASKNESNWDAE